MRWFVLLIGVTVPSNTKVCFAAGAAARGSPPATRIRPTAIVPARINESRMLSLVRITIVAFSVATDASVRLQRPAGQRLQES
jgi:hypothetical protein